VGGAVEGELFFNSHFSFLFTPVVVSQKQGFSLVYVFACFCVFVAYTEGGGGLGRLPHPGVGREGE